MVAALCRELKLRKSELGESEVKTIYFGGGTPSVLESWQIEELLTTVSANFTLAEEPEITLEANPDDLTQDKLLQLAETSINRLSIGVQSFRESDLKLMNRAHDSSEAVKCISAARKHFDNISIDLIYGIPGLSNLQWRENLTKAIEMDVPHISSYALTVEDRTALKSFIEKGLIEPVDDEVAAAHFDILLEEMDRGGYQHYEFSNFGKPGYFSENNLAYWMGKPYLGIGPSAHSYDGKDTRSWNVANNQLFVKSILEGRLPREVEKLTATDRYNEYVMTRLRTIYGADIGEVRSRFGARYGDYLLDQAKPFLNDGLLQLLGDKLLVSRKGKFLSDGIASELFMLKLG